MYYHPNLSVCIPTRNDDQRLLRCIRNFQEISSCDSIFIVDSGFHKSTFDISMELNCYYVPFDWNGSYPKKRNWFLLNQSLDFNSWVLFLDTDEMPTQEFAKSLSKILLNDYNSSPDVYVCTYANIFLGRQLRYGIPFRKACLCKGGRALFEDVPENNWSNLDMEVHEHLIPFSKNSLGKITGRILHAENKTHYEQIARHNEYSSWESARLYSGYLLFGSSRLRSFIKKKLLFSCMTGPIYFFINYLVFLGFLDGKPGYLYSLFKCSYFNDIAIKYSELVMGEHCHETRDFDCNQK